MSQSPTAYERRRRQALPGGVAGLTVSVRPARPGRVAPQQSPLPRHRLDQHATAVHTGTTDIATNLSPISLSQSKGAVHFVSPLASGF